MFRVVTFDASFGDHDYLFGSEPGIVDSESNHTPAAHSFNIGNHFLDRLRIQVASGTDDNVLGASGDEVLSLDYEGAIPGVQPATRLRYRLRSLSVSKVTFHGGWATKVERALDSVRKLLALLIDDPKLTPR